MKIVLGLGNPGREHASNRHNLGFWCVVRLARRLGVRLARVGTTLWEARAELDGEPLLVAKPRTYMNASGRAAAALLRRHAAQASDLIVAHDEADLAFGVVRVKQGGGHGGHNGLRSILEVTGARDFARVRMGLGRPESTGIDLADWVLEDFAAEEKGTATAMAERAAEAVEWIVAAGVTAAMNRFNTRH